ncbi:hypothetical protein LAZ67_19001846 [Cordylochernes scorpioides]|uniref:Uncharacterized protein n=1 Tax=Cordylochernes scorpioides TaxID=51811 RepID=A0ABY6LIB9_9ARAC|nr:hypothetical protein LAZ67_19001846 [Cordylochernes scorpioides]
MELPPTSPSTRSAQERSPRQRRTPSIIMDKAPPYPCHYNGGQHWHVQCLVHSATLDVFFLLAVSQDKELHDGVIPIEIVRPDARSPKPSGQLRRITKENVTLVRNTRQGH